MEGYNNALTFSAHMPGQHHQQRNNQTPKKKLNFPTHSPFATRGGNISRTP